MKADINKKIADVETKRRRGMAGISIIEVIIVLVIIAVLSAISLPYIYNSKRLYKSEDQALKVMDLMREASQLALTKRRTFRFEIDLSDMRMLIIDTRTTGAADDLQIKSIPLEPSNEVRMNVIPTGVTAPIPPPYSNAAFAPDTIGHLRNGTTVMNPSVWQVSFLSDGSAVTAAGVPISANLYFYPPLNPATASNAAPRSNQEVRAVTIFGGSGAVRYWKYVSTGTNTWAFKSY